jgi:RND family efflux transporter MFP subunit
MKFKIQFSILFLAISLMACKKNKNAETKLPASKTISVKTFQLQQSQGVVKINSTGMLTTENEAKYAFKIGGVIDRIFVNEGQFFKKGSLLAKLKIDEIDAGFTQAKLGLEKAERDLQRVTNLHNDRVATLEQLQNTKTAYEIAQKQLDVVAFNKQYAYIYASNSGFVTKKIANEGEIIGSGMPVLAINENTNGAWLLKVGLSDKDWAMVAIGNTAQIVFDAFPNKIFEATVFRKLLAADMGTGSFQVELKINFQGLNPAIGMFGKATINTNNTQKYQSIPYDALIEADGKSAFVFVPLPDGKVKRQAIEIESFDNTEVRVKSGLENIGEVIFTNSAFLNENSIITIIK